ncbi:laccase 3 [Tanacetum coccineum]
MSSWWGPAKPRTSSLTADQQPGRYYMAARAYATAQNAPFDNTTATAILEYKSATTQPILPQLPAYNDTKHSHSFSKPNKEPWKYNRCFSWRTGCIRFVAENPGSKQPGNDIDVYLAPLIDDMKTLWQSGVEVIHYRLLHSKHAFRKKKKEFNGKTEFRKLAKEQEMKVDGTYYVAGKDQLIDCFGPDTSANLCVSNVVGNKKALGIFKRAGKKKITVEDLDGLKDEITKPLREKIKLIEADLALLQASFVVKPTTTQKSRERITR